MEEKDFLKFRAELAEVMRGNRELCREGYVQLWRAQDVAGVAAVVRHYWAELNRRLWPEFQQLLLSHYPKAEQAFNSHGIHYNTTCDSGLCVVDEHCESDCLVLKGKADAVVHGNAAVLLLDQAQATLLDSARATAKDASSVFARGHSYVAAYGSARIKASDHARVVSDGATDIYLYDYAQLRPICYRRLDLGSNATLLGINENWKQ